MRKTFCFVISILAIMFSYGALSIQAAAIAVNSTADTVGNNGQCTLREAIANANNNNQSGSTDCTAGSGADTITITATGTITLTSALPALASDMTIDGSGASSLTISGNNSFRPFAVNSGTTVTIMDLTIANGNSSAEGGGITNQGTLTLTNCVVNGNTSVNDGGGIASTGTLNINYSTISNNTAALDGGGVASYGALTVTGSTFSGNSTNHQGGGIAVLTGGALNGSLSITNSTFYNNRAAVTGGGIGFATSTSNTITNCTITQNRQTNVGSSGGGLGVASGTVALTNTIVANNTKSDGGQSDIVTTGGTVNTSGSFNNLIGTNGAGGLTNGANGNQVGVADARLLPLGNYGGAVQTFPIRPDSPARNAGTNSGAPATDARGFSRLQEGTVDIGAFEIQANSIVTNVSNSGAGSLRDTVAAVSANEIIQFETPTFDTARTISLSGGQITIGKNLTVYGNGANLLTVQNTQAAAGTSRVFNISSGTVSISGMTISGGNLNGQGGGILNAGNLTITSCAVSGNQSTSYGGGIRNTGTLTVLSSTISGNSTAAGTNGAGGIDNGGILNLINSTVSGNQSTVSPGTGGIWSGGTAYITNSTITNNFGASGGDAAGGLYRFAGAFTLRNSIVAANQNNSTVPDIVGSFTSAAGGGNNIIGNRGTATGFTNNSNGDKVGTSGSPLNPMLQMTLTTAYGGTTPTHAVLSGSPAIDAGNNCVFDNTCSPSLGFALLTDQRGRPRQFNGNGALLTAAEPDGLAVDIGAVEFTAPTAASIGISGRVLTPQGRGLTQAVVSMVDDAGNERTAITSTLGYYRFEEVEVGRTYIFTVRSKRYQFLPQSVTVVEEIGNLDFFAQP